MGFFNNNEHIVNLSNESLQNLSGVYNTSQLTVTNSSTTGNSSVGGNLTVIGDSTQGGSGSTVLLNNSLKINNTHTGYSNDKTYGSEISNDISAYKTLMLVGNKSGGGTSRRIGMWDDVTIGGSLAVGTTLTVGGRNILAELDAIKSGYVPWGTNLETRPVNDAGKCFDFGSDGRTNCSNGWSVVKLNKR